MRSNQSRIEKLIAELCPEGVEFKDVGALIKDKTVITVNPPKKLTKNYYKSVGAFPIVDQGQSFIVGYTDDSNAVVANGLYVIFGDHTEAIKYVDFAFAQGADGIKVLKTHTDIINTRFFYYALNNFYEKTGKYTRHFSFLKKTKISIPPLTIQLEIVKILDTFTTLEAELEAELEARKKQYEYYQEELLMFGEGIQLMTLGDICDIRTGQAPNTEVSSIEGKFPFINAGLEPSGYLIEKNTPAETITIPSRGQGGAGHVGYQKSEFWCGPLCYRIQSNKRDFITKFIYYYLRTIQERIVGLRQTGSIPAVNRKELILIKVPSIAISEQERIAKILDKFDALVHDISIGLPAELNARRKQYEYYRNKLLTFKSL